MVKAIVFDMGGVLLLNRIEELLEKLAEVLQIDLETLKSTREKHVKELLIGAMTTREFIKLLRSKTGLEMKDEEILKIWKQSYLEVMQINEELFEIVEKLKGKYSIGLISNLPDLHAQINIERGLFRLFDPCLLSYKVGLAKPDKAIFKLLLQKLGLEARECIFIDDRAENLETPKELGFKTVHYESPAQLATELKNMGVELS